MCHLGMKKYALDTNCFINAVNPTSPSYDAVQRILAASHKSEVVLMVSLVTLAELAEKHDSVYTLGKTLPELPHWPIGVWNEQIGTWKQQTGTWDNARVNNQFQMQLKSLAKSGTDIRDRGAYIDALCSGLDGFVTSDKQLVGLGPQSRINEIFPTKVLTPEQLAEKLRV